jgi:GT2 family glycosyltransferase
MSVDQRRRAPAGRSKIPAVPDELPIGGSIERACWLADRLLLLVASFPGAGAQAVETWLRVDGEWRFAASAATVLDADARDSAGPQKRVLMVVVPEPEWTLPREIGPVVIRSRAADFVIKPQDIDTTVTESDEMLRELIALPRDKRAEIVDFLVRSTARVADSRRVLGLALHRFREALREPLPVSVVDPGEPRAAAIDAIWRIDDRAFYLEGWARHDGASLASLTAVTPEGEHVELASDAFRYARPDVSEFYGRDAEPTEKLGVIAYVETVAPSLVADGWVIELRDSLGGRVEGRAPQVKRDLVAARTTILGDLQLERLPASTLRERHIRPAIERIQERLVGRVAIDAVDQLGKSPIGPEVSIIVPLYGRVDFVEHQLAQFAHDPELWQADIVYVLDSPEQADALRAYALQLHRLYRMPFRIVTMTGSGGFSLANNVGASVADGRLLLLLNSDVLPERAGWLGEMVRFYDSNPAIGALSPKLLYEDESLQHAGLYFDRPEGTFVWANEHYYKGMHRDLPAANVVRRVPAVTGACLMISRALYETHGGLRGCYVQGDYEDSDLCLRLAAGELESWYLPAVALYHLEGQSYPSAERAVASQYNKWLHTHLWGDAIEDVMQITSRQPASIQGAFT